jgi:hypothetical protein
VKKSSYVVAIAAVVVWIGFAVYLWRQQHAPVATPVATPPVVSIAPTAPSPATSAASEPVIKHPIEAPVESPLAALPQDAEGALTELFGRKTALSVFQTQDFARRFVATVDNLGRSHAPVALWPVNPTPGRLVVEKRDGADVIGADNGLRYTAFVLLVESVDLHKAAATYVRLYPQLQQAYEALGFPNRYFNDRLVEVIDLLLATPDVEQPLRVRLPQINGPLQPERPWVTYEFEEPALQSLAAGQKILLRMGPVNERRMKVKLKEIRRLLTAGGLPRYVRPRP